LDKNKNPPSDVYYKTIPPKMDESGNGERKDIPPYLSSSCAKFIISKGQ
jgi:hypothetical protein